ncbi:MAG: hypothetical protein IPL38_10595 [Rhodobacter sp.]|jgi:hypothetical protein|nr:hypothetical protein [Rhodobacter sp.]MBK8439907.1 hypothetical protein [Rhodobacter sp.]
MIGYTDAPRAWWLTRGMARISGVNLPQAVVDGWLSRDELAGIIARCEGCALSHSCERWMAHSGRETAMPEFCPNKPVIESLSLQH